MRPGTQASWIDNGNGSYSYVHEQCPTDSKPARRQNAAQRDLGPTLSH